MRLKLNRALRAALIAAITAVGFTAPEAQGYTQDVGTVIETNWFYCKPSGITGRTLSAPEFDTINLTSDGVGFSIGIANLTTKDGGNLHIVGGNHWGGDRSFAPLTIDTIHAGEDGSGQVFIEAVPYGNKPVANTTVEIKAIEGTLAGLTNNAIMTLGSEGSTINALHTLQNAGADATLTLRGKFVFDTADAAGYTVKQEGQVVWSDAEKEQGFKTTTGSSYYLIKGAIEGGTLEVTTKEGQPAVTQESAGNYYFTAAEVVDTSRFYVNADTATLDCDCTGEIIFQKAGATLTVAENITFTGTITRNGYATSMVMATGAVVNSNALTLAGAATLNLSGPGTFNTTTLTLDGGSLTTSTNLNITASGNETVKSQGGASSLIVNGGTTTITGGIHYTSGDGSKVEVGTGQTEAKLVTGRLELGDTGGGKSYLNIGQNGTLVITSTNDASGSESAYKTTGLILSEWNQGTTASVAGKLYAQNVKMYHGDTAMDLTIENNGVVAVKGITKCANGKNTNSSIALKDGGKLILGDAGIANNGGNWNIALNGGEIGLSADTTEIGRAMSLNGNVTFNTAKYQWSGSGADLTLTQGVTGGTLTISGNITGDGAITKTGAGTLVLSGAANVLNNTIAVQAGALQLNGTFDITGNEGEMTTTYSDGENGFKTTSGTITVYTKGVGAEVTVDQGAQFIYGGTAVSLTPEGKYEASAHTDYSTYYVRVGSANLSSAIAQQDMQYIVMSDNTTLNMDNSWALSSLTTHGAASLANAGQDRQSLILGSVEGEGTVAVGDKIDIAIIGAITGTKDLTALKLASDATAQVTMGTGGAEIVNFGEGTGTVVLQGGSLSYRSNLGGNTLQMQSGSTLLFGSKGDDTDHTYEGDIVVAESATVTTYGTSQHPTATISGEVSGEGTLTRANDGNQTLYFTGAVDLGGYTNNDAQGGNLTDFRGVTHIGTLTLGGSSKTKFSNSETTIGAIVLTGDASTEFTQDMVITNLSGDKAWTVTTSGTLTLSGETTSIKKLQSTGNVVLAADTTVTLSNNLTPVSGTVEVYATLNVTGDIDLSNGGGSTGKLSLKDGSVTTAAGMWMASGASLLMEAGAVLNIGGLQIEGTGDGGITTTAENEKYSTGNANFTISNATVTSTGDNVTLGNTLVDTDVVVANGSRLTLNTDATNVTVGNGGTFYLNEGKNVTNLTVEDGGTIGGGVDASQVGIAAHGTATFEQGVSDGDVTFGWAPVQVTNNGEQTAAYSGIDDTNMRVTADCLYYGYYSEAETDVTVKNEVVVGEILNFGKGDLTLTHVATEPLQTIYIEEGAGAVTLQNVSEDPIVLKELSLPHNTVAVYKSAVADTTQEGTVTITGLLMAGGGTLRANLILKGTDGHVDLDLAQGQSGMSALTLGSKFGIAEGTLVTLDSNTISRLALMNVGDSQDLIKAAEGTTLTYGMDGETDYNGMWFGQLFERTEEVQGDYLVYATETGFGLTKVSNVPEPTTGTLSLLALASLCMRRRRK